MTSGNRCLLVRQPYASLIAYGLKRAEFRKYPTKIRGPIGIAASKGASLKTQTESLNGVSNSWPRGVVLAKATLVRTEFWDITRLRECIKPQREISVHNTKISIYDSPLGEPVEDVDAAIKTYSWQSWAWILDNVVALDHPVQYSHSGRSTWATF